MQEATVAADPGRRPAQQQFAGVDLRRPKGYAAAPPPAAAAVTATQAAAEGDPCPRCESTDTKFCYYNNYNTSQPRHFCKGCRRYWTKGGTLRNVPVGGGTRKKPSSSPPSSYAAAGNSGKPKKPYKKKRRVVAAAPTPEPAAADAIAEAPAADYAKTPTTIETTAVTKAAPTPATEAATPTTTADGASEITTELVVPAAAEEEDSLAHLLQPDVALGLGISDFPAAKGLLDAEPADSFEWLATFDLGTCWGTAGFADMDPAGLFLNLP